MNKITFYILILLSCIIFFFNISYGYLIHQGIRFSCNDIKNIKVGLSKKYILKKIGYPSILDLSNKKFIYIFYTVRNNKDTKKYLILILEFNKNKLINIKKYKKI